jgi:hypothetical protein
MGSLSQEHEPKRPLPLQTFSPTRHSLQVSLRLLESRRNCLVGQAESQGNARVRTPARLACAAKGVGFGRRSFAFTISCKRPYGLNLQMVCRRDWWLGPP